MCLRLCWQDFAPSGSQVARVAQYDLVFFDYLSHWPTVASSGGWKCNENMCDGQRAHGLVPPYRIGWARWGLKGAHSRVSAESATRYLSELSSAYTNIIGYFFYI